MKKLLSLFLLFVGLNIQAQDIKSIKIATEGAFPPFNFTDKDGKVVGLEIDFANALCAELKISCTIITQDWDGIIPSLIAKKYDVIIASLSITDERKQSIAFTKPYYVTGNSFVAKKGQFKNVTPTALAGKTIGFQKATISENFINENYKKSTFKSYQKVEEAYLDLTAGRLDIVFNDTLSHYGAFLNQPAGKDYAINGKEFFDAKYFGGGIGIGLRKDEKKLLELLNKGIETLYKNGTFKKISEKWIPGKNIMVK